MTLDFYFKPKCCPPKPLKKNIYNPEVLSKFPLNLRIAHQIVASVGTHNQCYTRVNVPLNAYGKWAGAPGGSGPGVSSTMNFFPYTNSSGLGPMIGGAVCNCSYQGNINTAFPFNIVTPVIYGDVLVGSTLTSTTGTWGGYPAPTLTYQWYRGAVAIPSATNNTYVTQVADSGQSITCHVTGTNTNGSAVAISNTITPISPQTITFTGVGNFDTIYVNSLNQVVVSPVLNGFTIYRVTTTSQGASYLINSNLASTPISFLIIGGGGSGAGTQGQAIVSGAGGAGGFIESSGTANSNTTYTIYVGKGGYLLNSTASGENSLLQLSTGTLTAIGGGGGGNLSTNLNGLNGGSGGGGSFNYNNGNYGSGGNGVSGQGFSGAPGQVGTGAASSGGGAGGDGISSSLNGGPGLPSSITGQSIYYAGGGGGPFRLGGIGGGGNGNQGGGVQATPGTNGLGGGGGGDSGGGTRGGDGVVILRVPSFT